jgi:phospholipase C
VRVNDGVDNLAKVDHVVVLMMENRSFDHMLGYLSLTGGRDDVDGLRRGMSNRHGGKTYRLRRLRSTRLGANQDPCHSQPCVREQLANGNGGFVGNYVRTHPDDPHPGLPMGYYDGGHLPVYDYLAREFCICERWFCSVPGPTWPNRLYATAGRSARSISGRVPLYDLPSFFRHLDARGVTWRSYYHDVPSLLAVDSRYRNVARFRRHFRLFDRRSTSGRSFLELAAAGELPAVSWIDPNYTDFELGPSGSNDDHPPADVMGGQDLVLRLANAVLSSPAWERTLLLITYDEHGGFFDHVPPPAAPDDDPAFRRFGARVPAFVVSPWVERAAVSRTLFDHTSIIKTLLLRFCRTAEGSIPGLGARTAAANHLGGLLTATRARRPGRVPDALVARVGDWRRDALAELVRLQAAGQPPRPRALTDLQRQMLALEAQLRAGGLPLGRP